MRISNSRLWVIFMALSFTGLANAEVQYNIIDLGVLPGGNASCAYGINNTGEVVGSSYTAGGVGHAFIWNSRDGMIDLGTLGGSQSVARSINNSGQVVGYAYTSKSNVHAFVWSNAGGMVDLGAFSGGYPFGGQSYAYGINNSGQVVGMSNGRAFLWESRTGMVDLGDLGGGYSSAYGINNLGQVVGYSPIGYDHAFIWDSSHGMKSLAALDSCSYAYAINDIGQVVGVARSVSENGGHAVLWETPSTMISLGHLGGIQSQAWGINNKGEIVGWSTISDSDEYHGFVYIDGQMFDLNHLIDSSLGWTLNDTYGINNNGWIVGTGINPDGYQHAFLLTPEPATVFLLTIGGLFLRKR